MNILKTFLKLILVICVCEIAGLIGTFFTLSEIPTWYAALAKPILNPPSWIFGPVWTTLYILMGIAAFLIWNKENTWKPGRQDTRKAFTIFILQLLLNSLWSIIFFGLHNPLLALIDICLLWLSIIWTMRTFYPLSKTTFWLLLPYILWVSFATYLNFSIWMLN